MSEPHLDRELQVLVVLLRGESGEEGIKRTRKAFNSLDARFDFDWSFYIAEGGLPMCCFAAIAPEGYDKGEISIDWSDACRLANVTSWYSHEELYTFDELLFPYKNH